MEKIIVIVGPTGVGKTKLSIALAKEFNGEIINADSMQVYKGLDIGTAKIKEEEKEGIPHHLFDIKQVEENYTVFDYQRDARRVIEEIRSRGKTPVMVGGTGLYIKAALYDYEFKKEEINDSFDELTNEELLQRIDMKLPNHGLHVNNRKRLIRTLNKLENNSYEEKPKGDNLLYDAIFVGLTTDRTILYDRINQRVDHMINDGLLEEVKSFYDREVHSKAIQTGIGYKECYSYFDGLLSEEDTISLIKQNSRNYAKRQYTWFRHQMNIKWFDVDFDHFQATVSTIITYIKEALL